MLEWIEESYAVVMEVEHAIRLAQKYHQNAIYYVSEKQLFLQSCIGDKQHECLGDFHSRQIACRE
ncbi:DUF3293 domain-containing protein [Vibrio sp. T187]|nr:DUF3293 domain-containing protein [Vibrio sp. T187]